MNEWVEPLQQQQQQQMHHIVFHYYSSRLRRSNPSIYIISVHIPSLFIHCNSDSFLFDLILFPFFIVLNLRLTPLHR
jgi:hypothetical protein